jgi:hypothetical protein
LYCKRFAGHASETTEVTTHPSLLYHVIHPLTPSSRSAIIPQEVQALLLEEGVTVTDLDMEDPLVFDSDVSAIYPPLTIDPDVHHHQPLPPAHPCPTTPVVANVRTDPTTAAPPPAAPAARNATTTITHLKAQVPHDTQQATETALKKHNQAVDRTYNASVKIRRTETCLDLGASIIPPDVVITPDVR